MKIELFELERSQSLWENDVDYNLADSGFQPFALLTILSEEEKSELLKLSLGYGHTSGDPQLRTFISHLYPDADKENVLVTNGSAEANFLSTWSLVNNGDELVILLPNYMQIWGIAKSFGAKVKTVFLKEKLSWQPDLEELKETITNNTKMIALCNPNNPTGSILNNESRKTIIDLAKDYNLWLLADEVYRGAELDGNETPSFFGEHEKVIAVGGLSKAYALPGLRLGWIVGPKETISRLWSYHDYTTISPNILSQYIAGIILSNEERRRHILDRNRILLLGNLDLFNKWLESFGEHFSFHPQQAGAMSFVHYDWNINATEFTNKLREEQSVLIVSGDCFLMDKYLRIGIGGEGIELKNGLERIKKFIEDNFEI
ncbi:MAG: aminotransferase class I/II-fold pyridoxal phosphate-dependent enzyme [Candidatus Heimdallarchaeaceae archaeon]